MRASISTKRENKVRFDTGKIINNRISLGTYRYHSELPVELDIYTALITKGI